MSSPNLQSFLSEMFRKRLESIFFWRTALLIGGTFLGWGLIGLIIGLLTGKAYLITMLALTINAFFLFNNGSRLDNEIDESIDESLNAICTFIMAIPEDDRTSIIEDLKSNSSSPEKYLSCDRDGEIKLVLLTTE